MLVETEDSRVKRDTESKALLASNANDRDRIRSTRKVAKKLLSNEARLDNLEQGLEDIKKLLTSIATNLNK